MIRANPEDIALVGVAFAFGSALCRTTILLVTRATLQDEIARIWQETKKTVVLITNDPWIGTSQLNDMVFVSPIFHRGRLVGYAANIAHSPDVGGRLLSADARELFEEGLRLPISKLIERRSAGQLKFHVASLYPLLYRLEDRGWIEGRWRQGTGERRRRCYRLTVEGRKVLAAQRTRWTSFIRALSRAAGLRHA